MRYLKALAIVLVTATILAASPLPAAPNALAQDGGDQCAALASDALATAREACAGLEPGQVCYGHASLNADGIDPALPGDGWFNWQPG